MLNVMFLLGCLGLSNFGMFSRIKKYKQVVRSCNLKREFFKNTRTEFSSLELILQKSEVFEDQLK